MNSVVDSGAFGLEAVAGICEMLYAIRLGVIQTGFAVLHFAVVCRGSFQAPHVTSASSESGCFSSLLQQKPSVKEQGGCS